MFCWRIDKGQWTIKYSRSNVGSNQSCLQQLHHHQTSSIISNTAATKQDRVTMMKFLSTTLTVLLCAVTACEAFVPTKGLHIEKPNAFVAKRASSPASAPQSSVASLKMGLNLLTCIRIEWISAAHCTNQTPRSADVCLQCGCWRWTSHSSYSFNDSRVDQDFGRKSWQETHRVDTSSTQA